MPTSDSFDMGESKTDEGIAGSRRTSAAGKRPFAGLG